MGQLGVRHRASVVFAALGGIVVGGLVTVLTLRQPVASAVTISTAAPTATPAPTATAAPIRVYVSGAVAQADVYELPARSIVRDALVAAGGATADADLERVNLALELHDQQQIHVPRQGDLSSPLPIASGDGAVDGVEGGLININTASASELEQLPRIGPNTAQSIIDYREQNGPFARIEDIQNVSGIGATTFAQIKDRITVE